MKLGNKGFELSTNFLVTLILSITVLSFGIYFARNVFHHSEDITKIPYEDFEKEIENVLCSKTQKVCVGQQSKEVYVGKHVVYTLVIQNFFDSEKTFEISMSRENAFTTKNNPITDNEKLEKIQFLIPRKKYKIQPYDFVRVPIVVQPNYGALHGKYLLKIHVSYESDSGNLEDYDNELIYVVVK